MPTFICSMNWTDQGIRTIKDAMKRRGQSKILAGDLGITIKDIYITSGDSDILMILEAPDEDRIAQFALVVGSRGNVRTSSCRAFTEAESEQMLADAKFQKALNERPPAT